MPTGYDLSLPGPLRVSGGRVESRGALKGKTIQLYLVDGVPTGLLTAEIINWSGKVLVAPRCRLTDLAHRTGVKRTGFYFLVGTDSQSPSRLPSKRPQCR